jgi:hypothetical protein
MAARTRDGGIALGSVVAFLAEGGDHGGDDVPGVDAVADVDGFENLLVAGGEHVAVDVDAEVAVLVQFGIGAKAL